MKFPWQYPGYTGVQAILMVILTYIAYMLLGTIALIMIFTSVSITKDVFWEIISMSDGGAPSLMNKICTLGRDSIPFSELFEELLDSSGVFSAFSDCIIAFTKPETYSTIKNNLPSIMRDLSVMSLAHLIYFVFKKLKDWMNNLKSCLFSSMLVLISVLWVCASFCLADLIVFLLENIVVTGKEAILHIIILLVCMGIHGAMLAFFAQRSAFIKVLVLLLESGFDCVRALCIWLWVHSVAAMYSENFFDAWLGSVSFIFRTLFFAILFWIIEILEKYTTAQYD